MSRSIIVSNNDVMPSEGVAFLYQTWAFESIVEGIRAGFEPQDSECLKLCFEDLDDHYLGYISLSEVDKNCFKLFLAAAEDGLRVLKEKKELPIDRYASESDIDTVAFLWVGATASCAA